MWPLLSPLDGSCLQIYIQHMLTAALLQNFPSSGRSRPVSELMNSAGTFVWRKCEQKLAARIRAIQSILLLCTEDMLWNQNSPTPSLIHETISQHVSWKAKQLKVYWSAEQTTTEKFPLRMSWGKGHLNSNTRNSPKSIELINISQICFNLCDMLTSGPPGVPIARLSGLCHWHKHQCCCFFILFLIVHTKLMQIKTRNQCNLQFYSTDLSGRGRPNPIVPPELTSLTWVLQCWPSIMHGPVFPWFLIESQHLRVVIFNLLHLICDTSTRVSWIMQTATLIVSGFKTKLIAND